MRPPIALRSSLLLAALALVAAGCSPDNPTAPWPPITDPLVFGDTFGANVQWHSFAGSKLDAAAIDSTVKYQGTASLRFTVPNPGDPSGTYAGGAMVTTRARDLTGYNALSLWVRASRPVSLDVIGFGNDNTGSSLYTAQRSAVPVTTNWTQVLVPIPLADKLRAEEGLCFLAEGPEGGAGLTLWVDEIRFVNVGTVTNPRPVLTPGTVNALVGATVSFTGSTRTLFTVNGLDATVTHLPGYFTFLSSDPTVATPYGTGLQVLAAGTTSVTAKLGTIAAVGTITLNATEPPTVAAPTPTLAAADVISLFSNTYTNRPVDTWSASWDQADVADVLIAGNTTKVYTNHVYAGIEFTTQTVDATAMTHFHMDVWIPAGTVFRVKLVDFGPDGLFGTDDSESELAFDGASTPPLATGQWVSLDIPFANFTSLVERAHLAQLILSGDTRTVYVDNVYFHR